MTITVAPSAIPRPCRNIAGALSIPSFASSNAKSLRIVGCYNACETNVGYIDFRASFHNVSVCQDVSRATDIEAGPGYHRHILILRRRTVGRVRVAWRR